MLAVLLAATAFATDELPAPDDEQPLEIEPPLLPQNLTADKSSPDEQANDTSGTAVDVARVEADLARAKKSAASGDRLFKAGILAKVEAEERALKVVRLEAKLADAQLQQAKAKIEELNSSNSADEAAARELQAAEAVVADATQNAARAADAKRVAEVEAAARNVERQQKLLTLGSGRKADVNRAEEKLAELQQATK
jgi:hypothetical protein